MQSDQTLRPDLVEAGEAGGDAEESGSDQEVTEPGKLIRIATMTRSILEEVRAATPDEAGRELISKIHDRSLDELRDVLSEELLTEFDRMFEPLLGDDPPTSSEVRIAQAQLIGWLEGLFQGIQASLVTRQMMAQAQAAQRAKLKAGRPEPEDRPATGLYL
ncbi:MAG: DUF2587 domain-containing protein [Acidimicrobiia bacterium]|nr:DUF2587 domain-containing protein [bacterium]MXW69176.1 DUF2587 domain-containing protein [Acidimicrobiia bacterium]MDE0673610.1 DUF2587 domain-containing protein [bacterium]MXX01621.1 DUF2587 domain-containing protein [Acidimicrobiia bacterium]MXY74949.1 DUF2587 domain-containing protein [Acidimicrobiia bacterium]